MASIMLGRYAPPGRLDATYPPELERIIVRALASEAAHRFPTAEAMRESLEQYLASSGPPVTTSQIANLLRERCADVIDARTQSLQSEAAPAPPAPAVVGESGAGAMEIDRRPATQRRSLLWGFAAVLIGCAMGIGVLSYVRAIRKARAKTLTHVELPAAPTSAVTPPIPAPTESVSATPSVPVESRVRIRVLPAEAVLVVDGTTLPQGTDSVVRPKDGGTSTVIVRADDHEDAIVLIDGTTPEEVSVALMAVTPRKKGRVKQKDAEAAESPPDAPPNPYE
jgi:serine/threonine-protein kinase